MNIIKQIQEELTANQDLTYKTFTLKLLPGVDPEKVIGVRLPIIKKLAKKWSKEAHIYEFLAILPHQYFEENGLHEHIIADIKDYDKCINEIDRFIPFIDNWATCDTLAPKCFKKKDNKSRLIEDIKRWLASTEPFTIRFGQEMLLSHFLDEDFHPEYLEWVARETNDHYYVRMMVAWFFATALAKQWDATIPYIENPRMEKWTHNKAIQKAIESYRITPEQKEYLRTLKMK